MGVAGRDVAAVEVEVREALVDDEDDVEGAEESDELVDVRGVDPCEDGRPSLSGEAGLGPPPLPLVFDASLRCKRAWRGVRVRAGAG